MHRRLGSLPGPLLLCLLVACQSRTRLTPNVSTDTDATPVQNDGGESSNAADGGTPGDASVPSDAGDAAPESDASTGGDASTPVDAGEADASRPPEAVAYRIEDWSDFSELATGAGELKFLLPTDAHSPHACWFQNTSEYPYHLDFLRALPDYAALSVEGYRDLVLTRATRTFYAGVLRLFSGAAHPKTGAAGILTYSVYAGSTPSEMLTVDELAAIQRQLAGCMTALSGYLVYLPENDLALAFAEQASEALTQAGVVWIAPRQLQPDVAATVYSDGEAYGYVRHVTDGDVAAVTPRDVVVASGAPGELGLVAALVTEQVQSSVSHLNLRLREKHIPNAAAPGLFDSGFFESMEGVLVHVTTTSGGLTVTPARLTDAEAFWASHRPNLPSPVFTLDVTEPKPLSALRHTDSRAFGTKAANLGELSRALPEGNVPHGIGLPFSAYANHVTANGLQAVIDEAVHAASTSAPAAASEILSDLRKRIKQAPLDATWEQSLLTALAAEFGDAATTTRLRFRSSTNVEDLPGLSGAGLYDSASGCLGDDLDDDEVGPSLCLTTAQATYYHAELERLQAKLAAHPELSELAPLIADAEQELTEEKSAHKALRKVWASLWNDRAFQDRQYYGIDHARVFMGIAVHPSMVGERLESVMVTNLEPDASEPLYRVESQAGEVGVVEPQESDAITEVLRFRRGAMGATQVTLVTPSSFSSDGQSLWSSAQLTELTSLAFTVQDYFVREVYPDLSPLQLDLEVDVSAEGEIVFKQARPYVSGAW